VSVIDVTPETLRQRLRDGSIYPADRVDQALQNFFRKSNLSGLREPALRVVAEDVDERLERSYSRRRIPGPVGAKEVIMVCVSHYPRAVKLIGRGDRMAARMKADMYVLFIAGGGEDSLSEKERANLVKLKTLSDECEGEFIIEPRNDRKTGEVIADVASRYNVTQIVIGQPAPDRKWELWRENPVRYLLRNLRYTDLRIVGWRDPPETMLKLPKSSEVQSDGSQSPRLRGRLTTYVGAAPGVGKTYKMLQDARDWRCLKWRMMWTSASTGQKGQENGARIQSASLSASTTAPILKSSFVAAGGLPTASRRNFGYSSSRAKRS
jgi:two-component system, OmpR family, sensor histidine kinase KdpD